MLRIGLKIALVTGAAFWVFSGNRSIELIAFFGVMVFFLGYDIGFPVREKFLLDPPEGESDIDLPEKILDGVLILILLALGVYIVKTNAV